MNEILDKLLEINVKLVIINKKLEQIQAGLDSLNGV